MQLEFSGFRKVVLTAFGICALAVTLTAIKVISAKSDVTHPESANLAQLAARSGKLYPDLNQPPYTPSPYGPLFYFTVKFIGGAVGDQIEQTRVGCRVFVFGTFLLLPIVVYLHLRSATLSPALSILGAFASISFYFMPLFAATVRPDIPALLLSVFALWLGCRRPSPRRIDLILSGVVCAAAFMFKESFVAAPLAIITLLVTQKLYRDLSVFASTAIVSAFLFLDLMFHGEPVIHQLLFVGKTPTDLRSAMFLIVTCLPTGFGALLLPAACVGFLMGIRSTEWHLRLYSYYFLFAVTIGFTTLLQCGGNIHYFFELWVAGALLFPAVFMKLKESWERTDWSLKIGAFLVLAFLFVQQTYAIRQVTKDTRDFNVVKLNTLHILSTEPYLTVQGRDPLLLDPFLNSVLEKKQQWSPEPILAETRQQEFDVVFMNEINHSPVTYRTADLFSPAIQGGLRANYRPICRTTSFVVLKPLRREVAFTSDDASTVLGERCYANGDETF